MKSFFPDTATRVAIRADRTNGYPAEAPFDPDCAYPEYPTREFTSARPNVIYGQVRQALADLGLDRPRLGSSAWSPFSNLIHPGNTVVVKPNLVLQGPEQDAITTHASVVRPLVDYAWMAMEGQGEILICDAPVAQTIFSEITRRNGLAEMVRQLQDRGVRVSLHDLRALRVVIEHGVWVGEQEDAGGRAESVVVNLGRNSAFSDERFDSRGLHGGSYDRRFTVAHQRGGTHEYCVSRALLGADVVISVPKLKTHSKAGLTCCLKNLVGINVDKNYLAHFRVGPANQGGDEFPPLSAWRVLPVNAVHVLHDLLLARHWRATGRAVAAAAGALRSLVGGVAESPATQDEDSTADWFYRCLTGTPSRQGAWQGNETIWRMILDLNRIFLYARADGTMTDTCQRRVFYVVDGIVAGEGNGPLRPTPRSLGIVACGGNALMVDLALLDYLGVEPERVPLYREAVSGRYPWLGPPGRPSVLCNGVPWGPSQRPATPLLLAPPGWQFRAE